MRLGRLFSVFFGAFLALAGLGASGSEAWSKGEIKYVNEAQVFQDSRAGKSLADQVKTRQQNLRARRDKEQKDLSGERDKIVGQKDVLSEKAFEERQGAFLQKVRGVEQALAREEEAVRKDLERAYASMKAVLDQILLEILKERDLGYIANRKSFLAARPEDDLTSEVIARLNRRLPRVTLAGGDGGK